MLNTVYILEKNFISIATFRNTFTENNDDSLHSLLPAVFLDQQNVKIATWHKGCRRRVSQKGHDFHRQLQNLAQEKKKHFHIHLA